MASTLDLLPTILKLIGVEAKKGVVLDGYDMGPILFEGKKVRAVNGMQWWITVHLRVCMCTKCMDPGYSASLHYLSLTYTEFEGCILLLS